MSKAIYTENKCIRERLREFISDKKGQSIMIKNACEKLNCLINSIYVPLRELESEGLLSVARRGASAFTVLPAIPLQEPTETEDEEKLWDEAENIFDKNTSPTGGGYEADYTYKGGFFSDMKSKFSITRKK